MACDSFVFFLIDYVKTFPFRNNIFLGNLCDTHIRQKIGEGSECQNEVVTDLPSGRRIGLTREAGALLGH